MTEKFGCTCGSHQFIRAEQVSARSPHPQHWTHESYFIRCSRKTCDRPYIWNFSAQRWDDGAANISADEFVMYYSRRRSSYDGT